MKNELHVIFGTGPVGCWIARVLCEMGMQVRAVNRSGKRPKLMPDEVELVVANLMDAKEAHNAAKGASVIYQALNPPYHLWHKYFPTLQANTLEAAKRIDARYVSIDNLYMYDTSKVITENSLIAPRSKKGQLRAQMAQEVMDAHKRGDVQATILRSSDYYGPGVINAAMGGMVFGNLIANKKAQIMGDDNVLHSWAYIEDVAKSAVILGTRDDVLGQTWITPHDKALTQKEMITLTSKLLDSKPDIQKISPILIRVIGLFVPAVRASIEMLYEFTEPFIVDSRKIEKKLKIEPTPIKLGIEKTVAWYRKI